jgi:hypothetical protein
MRMRLLTRVVFALAFAAVITPASVSCRRDDPLPPPGTAKRGFPVTFVTWRPLDDFQWSNLKIAAAGGVLNLVFWSFMAFCVLSVPTFLGELRDEDRRLQGRCPNCGYDLRGNTSGRCPECGAATSGR